MNSIKEEKEKVIAVKTKSFKEIEFNAKDDFEFYKISEITYEEEAPKTESLLNVLTTMCIPNINLIYLIRGNKKGVSFFYGISKDLINYSNPRIDIKNIGDKILKPSIEANFRGSKVLKIKKTEKCNIHSQISSYKFCKKLEGIPGIIKDNEKYQGIDKLVDTMIGEEFSLVVVAKPLFEEDINYIEKDLYDLYDLLTPISKYNNQESKNESNTYIDTKISGSSDSEAKSNTKTTQNSTTTNYGKSVQKGSTENIKDGTKTYSTTDSTNASSKSNSSGESEGNTTTRTSNKSTNTGTNKTIGSSSSKTFEYTDKEILDLVKYIDENSLKRVENAINKGAYISNILLLSNEEENLVKLSNTAKAIFSGSENNKYPIKESKNNSEIIGMLKKFQTPKFEITNEVSKETKLFKTLQSKYIKDNYMYFGSFVTTNELSIISNLPQKEVLGLSLKQEVNFGLNYNLDIDEKSKITLGNIVQSGKIIDCVDISLDKKELNKHIFIAGVTGSGKTTTCQRILKEYNQPFMVIEPAKTEYRVLLKEDPNILIFTLGNEKISPFRLNPFEIIRGESITSRVDMIKACIESAFDMEAAIPQIIETAIYECYKDYGWDITDDTYKYGDPFEDGVYSFPTISDLINKIESVVIRQGFDDRLKNDYIGSIKARLQSLSVGSKGLMLDTPRSIDFKDLLDKKVILELEDIKSANEKSLVMGFVLINLIESIKAKHNKKPNFNHITLIEEAHRLMSKINPGDSKSKQNAVETFSDMLAEIRKYGESLIIVDQIPAKLTPEVLKNTNTKIVHKIFAEDDKEALGNTMALTKDQKEFLSQLEVGRAVVFSQGWTKSIQLQVKMSTNTTSFEKVLPKAIREKTLRYYEDSYKKGIFPGISHLTKEEAKNIFATNMSMLKYYKLISNEYEKVRKQNKITDEFKELLIIFNQKVSLKNLANYILKSKYYKVVNKDLEKEMLNNIEMFLKDAIKDKNAYLKYHQYLSIRGEIK